MSARSGAGAPPAASMGGVRRSNGSGPGRSRWILAALAVAVATGCYRYAPTELSVVPAGTDVRIHVQRGVYLDQGTVPLGQEETRLVRGRIVESPYSDTLLCSVLVQSSVSGAASRGLRSTVSIPRSAVEEVEVRRLDRLRTFSLVGVGVVLSAIIVDASFDIRNANEGPEGSDNVNNAVLTLFRIRW